MNSKSKRKFRIWDNKLLFQTLEKTLQIRLKIDEACGKDNNPEDLPMSVLPTHTIYDIALCYEAMYEKLMEEELVVAGYPKSNKTYH